MRRRSAAFFGISIGLHALAATETILTPATAAWAPLLIFGPTLGHKQDSRCSRRCVAICVFASSNIEHVTSVVRG